MKKIIKRARIKYAVCFLICVSMTFAVVSKTDAAESGMKMDVLDLSNMDVYDVLKLISKKSGLNIIAGQNVKGRVTVYLKDIDVLDALKFIVEANGWAFDREGDVIKVMTAPEYEAKYGHPFGSDMVTEVRELRHAQPSEVAVLLQQIKSTAGKILVSGKTNALILMDTPDKLVQMNKVIDSIDVMMGTKIFELSYARADDISSKVLEVLSPDIGTMKIDERSNTLIVTDTPAKIEEVDRLIVAFDRKDKEVLVEAKIVQITLTDDTKLGVDWEAIVSDFHNLDFTNDFDILTSSDKSGRLSIGTLDSDQYTATVEALQTIGRTKILSSPSIATINNQEAKILVGSTEPYVTSTTTTPASGPTTTAESVNFIDVGVKLYVTPTIHNDGYITMFIKPEVSSVTSNLTTSNNNTIPIVETTEAETIVTVKNGVTIVIGGLIKNENISQDKGVPLLQKVPVLGMFFRSSSTDDEKQEIAIFLTPTIITGDAVSSSSSNSTHL